MSKYVAGYSSGMCLVLAGHPFDTIKVRMQTQGTKGKFTSATHCVKQTLSKEGFRGLYKGMAAPLLATGVINSLLFGFQMNVAESVARFKGRPDDKPELVDTMQAAIGSGLYISLFVAPMEGIKSRLQVQYNAVGETAKYSGPLDAVKKVYAEQGLTRGIYRGWFAVALCRMSNWAYFGGYAATQAIMVPRFGTGPKGELPLWASLLSGGMAGVCYWLSCYPLDVIKARIQASPTHEGFLSTVKTLYQTEGIKAFGKGFTPCALRAIPANAAAFFGYEAAMKLLRQDI